MTMETATRLVPEDGFVELVNARESDGWAVRFIVPSRWEDFVSNDGEHVRVVTEYRIVFERERVVIGG